MRFCYSLTEDQLSLLREKHLPEIGFEIRLDSFTAMPMPAAIRAATNHPLLATWRSEPHLGRGKTEEREDIGWARRMACLEAGFDLIDVELDEIDLDQKIARIQNAGAKVVLSHHDLGEGDSLDSALKQALATNADIIKIIGTGHLPADILRQRVYYQRAAKRELVMFFMGAEYAATRVLCMVLGAPFTFLTPNPERAVAPGQLTLEAVTQHFRPLDIELDKLKLFAVIGSPIGHSRSPEYHNNLLKARDPHSLFVALPANMGEDLKMLLAAWPELRGMAVTKPMKEPAWQAAQNYLDDCSEHLGAVNTLLRKDEHLAATNTDLLAMIELLRAEGNAAHVRILGYGGLGKAVAAACRQLGISYDITNRTPGKVPEGEPEIDWSKRHQAGPTVIVQATSAGMAPHVELSPMDEIPDTVTHVIETIYNPTETRLMQMANSRGIRITDGHALFDGQAKIQNTYFQSQLR